MGRVTTLSSIAVANVTGPKYCVSFDDPEQVCERQRDTGSRGGLVLLVRPTRHDLQRINRQRPLQRLRFIPGGPHPDVSLLIGRQDH